MSWEAIAAFLALGLTSLTALVLTMRGLAKIELSLRIYFEAKLVDALRALREDISESRTMFGETVKAAREHAELAHKKVDEAIIKHQNLELYIRDNYVSFPTFEATLKRIEHTIGDIDEKVDKLMARPNVSPP